MGNRCYILDQNHVKSSCLKRPQSSLSTGTWALDVDFNISHPVFHGLLGRILCGKLGRKRRTLTGALKTLYPRAGPRHDVACRIRDGHNGIVECGLNMGYPVQDVLLLFSFSGRSCHDTCFASSYFFLLPETLRRGPFRVLALVLVRCPRTGSDFRCRSPR